MPTDTSNKYKPLFTLFAPKATQAQDPSKIWEKIVLTKEKIAYSEKCISSWKKNIATLENNIAVNIKALENAKYSLVNYINQYADFIVKKDFDENSDDFKRFNARYSFCKQRISNHQNIIEQEQQEITVFEKRIEKSERKILANERKILRYEQLLPVTHNKAIMQTVDYLVSQTFNNS